MKNVRKMLCIIKFLCQKWLILKVEIKSRNKKSKVCEYNVNKMCN